MEFIETYRFRQEPDVYTGPQWVVGIEKEGDHIESGDIIFDPVDYPPGTRIIIQEPLCPECGEIYDNCMVRGGNHPCNFDWELWAEEQYS